MLLWTIKRAQHTYTGSPVNQETSAKAGTCGFQPADIPLRRRAQPLPFAGAAEDIVVTPSTILTSDYRCCEGVLA
jgi:hypothetical protein